jgi:hypothetical protein
MTLLALLSLSYLTLWHFIFAILQPFHRCKAFRPVVKPVQKHPRHANIAVRKRVGRGRVPTAEALLLRERTSVGAMRWAAQASTWQAVFTLLMKPRIYPACLLRLC